MPRSASRKQRASTRARDPKTGRFVKAATAAPSRPASNKKNDGSHQRKVSFKRTVETHTIAPRGRNAVRGGGQYDDAAADDL
jgi:hypothetical protein